MEISNETGLKNYLEKLSFYTTVAICCATVCLLISLFCFAILCMPYEDTDPDQIEELPIANNSKLPKNIKNSNISRQVYNSLNSKERIFIDCLVPSNKIKSFATVGGLQNEIKMIKKVFCRSWKQKLLLNSVLH